VRDGETIFQWLFQPLVHAGEEFFLRFFPQCPIVSREQAPGDIQPEQRHGVITLFTQSRSENAVVGEGMTIDFTRRSVWQASLRGLPVAQIHLLVTFVTVKRSAPRVRRRVLLRLQLRQPAQQHVDLEDRALIGRVRLKWFPAELRQHVATEVHEDKPRLDYLFLFRHLKLNGTDFSIQSQSEYPNTR
jgi:hypothetical protein